MARSRTLVTFLTLLSLFLVGTVIVLSTVSYYLAIDPTAYLTEIEIPPSAGRVNSSEAISREQIPRIIHQTWKSDVLPDRWKAVSRTCKKLMPDYEYMLWTDQSARDFIAKEYAWFLPTFDGYTYPIQRADAIRYFVLHFYGGVYLDLDVGCKRPLDPLLVYPVVLPKTIPVGVSNDLMFSAKGHPFMAQTIHNLITFDHNWVLNYPTVMFSTGPMFVSAQYGLYTTSHPFTAAFPQGDVRILSKPLYGKNAKPDEAPNAFFTHHYGSSWHADDAAFITFLGQWGRFLMKIGLVVLAIGVFRLFWYKRRGHVHRRRRTFAGHYDIFLPRTFAERNQGSDGDGLDVGMYSYPSSSTGETTPSSPETVSSPIFSDPPSPTTLSATISYLPLPFDLQRPSSPALSTISMASERTERAAATVADAFRRAGLWAISVPSYLYGRRSSHRRHRDRSSSNFQDSSPPRTRHRRSDSILTLVPAIFTPTPHRRTFSYGSSRPSRSSRSAAATAKASEAGFTLPSDQWSSPAETEGALSHPESGLLISVGPDDAMEQSPHVRDEIVPPRELTPSPLLIDPLAGSDVRTTRSASASVAQGMPPPYRAASGRGSLGGDFS